MGEWGKHVQKDPTILLKLIQHYEKEVQPLHHDGGRFSIGHVCHQDENGNKYVCGQLDKNHLIWKVEKDGSNFDSSFRAATYFEDSINGQEIKLSCYSTALRVD